MFTSPCLVHLLSTSPCFSFVIPPCLKSPPSFSVAFFAKVVCSLLGHRYHQPFSALSRSVQLLNRSFHLVVVTKFNEASALRLAVVIQNVRLVHFEASRTENAAQVLFIEI